MRKGMSGAGASSIGTGGGTSRWTSVPAATIVFARIATPSAVRRPSEINFCTWLRERPVASATNRSIRPGGPSGTRSLRIPGAVAASGIGTLDGTAQQVRQEGGDDQEQDRARDRGIGDVERVEPQVPESDIDPVDDVAESEAVGHVPQGSAEEQAERDRRERVATGAPVVPDDQRDHADRDEAEQERLVLEQAEQRTRVLRMDDPDEIAEHLAPFARPQDRGEPQLRELIDDDDRRRKADEQRPASPATIRRDVHARRRRAIATGPSSRSTEPLVAPAGTLPSPSVASVSARTLGRWRATASGSPTTHSSIRSSSSRPASRRS